jgi:hypothetical protein
MTRITKFGYIWVTQITEWIFGWPEYLVFLVQTE